MRAIRTVACFVVFTLGALVSAQTSPQSDTAALAPPRDIAQLKTRAEAGDAQAQFALGSAYEDGKEVEQNDELAAQWYRKAADGGNAAAQNSLGVMYRMGRGIEKNPEEAVRWYQRAVQQGFASAMFNMGAAYYNGDGVGRNEQTAGAWFLLAQEAGSKAGADAFKRSLSEHASPDWIFDVKLRIAIMLEEGEGLKADPPAAEARYTALASDAAVSARVRVEANLRLARLYTENRGLRRDPNAARQHCEAAANLRSGQGCFCLGFLNERGLLGDPNFAEAAHWYSEAVHYGDNRAMVRLGKLYENGQGVKQDDVEALKWYILAIGYRQADAKPAADALVARLSKKETAKAAQRAQEWRRSNRF